MLYIIICMQLRLTYRRRYVGGHVIRLGLDGRYSQGAPVQGGRHQGGQRGTSGRAAILGPRVSRRPRAGRCRTHGGGCSFYHKTIAAVGDQLGPRANYNTQENKRICNWRSTTRCS